MKFSLSYPIKKIGFGLFFSLSIAQSIDAQISGQVTLISPESQTYIDSIAKEYSTNKKFSTEFKLPAMIALSYYPELKNTRIEFVNKSIRTTMACRPKWNFIFKRKENRVYRVFINNNAERVKGAMLADVPYNAQIGLIGHELGHVADYAQSGVFRIIGMGFKYLFTPGRMHVERKVDKITIDHQLGWQLYDFCDFILNRSTVSEEYKEYKRKVYYKPEEILLLIQQR